MSVCNISTLIVSMMVSAPLPKEQCATIRGKVVWAENNLPARQKIEIRHWPTGSPKPVIYNDELVVNPKNNGVRWAVIFLARLNKDGIPDPTITLPIHSSLKEVQEKNVYVDMPKMQFEPHIVTMRDGQQLTLINSSSVPSCTRVVSPEPVQQPNVNVLLKQKQEYLIKKSWKGRYLPILMDCALYRHMRGFLWKFPHPYYAVTDENGKFEIPKVMPGKYQLISWHEEAGWLKGGRTGIEIIIEEGTKKNIGQITMK